MQVLLREVTMPSQEELKSYAATLPTIYKDVLSSFVELEPDRWAGDSLAFKTIADRLAVAYTPREVDEACERLVENGFLQFKHDLIIEPTELGEGLIEALTGRRAPHQPVPELPKPTW